MGIFEKKLSKFVHFWDYDFIDFTWFCSDLKWFGWLGVVVSVLKERDCCSEIVFDRNGNDLWQLICWADLAKKKVLLQSDRNLYDTALGLKMENESLRLWLNLRWVKFIASARNQVVHGYNRMFTSSPVLNLMFLPTAFRLFGTFEYHVGYGASVPRWHVTYHGFEKKFI